MNINLASSADEDAVNMLISDHRQIEKSFAEYERHPAIPSRRKKVLADFIGEELLIHMALEEEIFYPAIRKVFTNQNQALVNHGIIEHALAKRLIHEIKAMRGDEKLFDIKVNILKKYIKNHVSETETELFPKVWTTSLDLGELAEKMVVRRAELHFTRQKASNSPMAASRLSA